MVWDLQTIWKFIMNFGFLELMYRLIAWKFIHVVDLGFMSVEGLYWRFCYEFEISKFMGLGYADLQNVYFCFIYHES